MPTQPLLSICIISFNTAELTLDAVRSAVFDILTTPTLATNSEIIVVDNDSSDDSLKVLKSFKSTSKVPITILENKTNTGFAAANNQVILQANGQYILLLNSDTYVQPGALEKLVTAFRDTPEKSSADLSSYHNTLDRLGIVAATLVNPDGTYQPQGGSYPSLFSLAVHMLMLIKIPLIGPFLPSTQKDIAVVPQLYSDYPSLVKQDWVAGTAMMLRKDTLQEIGGLDEAIFMYAEDMELCVRAKDHHWDIAVVPGAYITHHKTASSNPGKALLGEMKGYQYIWAKHKAAWQLGIATLLMKAGASLRILVFGTMRQPEKVRTYKTALHEL